MKKIFDKTWDHKKHEAKIYQNWEESGYFKPEINFCQPSTDRRLPANDQPLTVDPFTIAIPPPNVTGALHIGHALFATLQDIMTRYHRLQGQPTLWIPGTDHAGIATQTVVDKMLKKQGINRFKIGRDKFLEHVWQWKEQYGGKINQQLRAVGSSCDWSRERFTMDNGLSRAVNEAFIHLYNKGLIYRGEYIVNWCPKCGTAIADDEVEYVEQKAKLYYFKYDQDFPITIATTRPETKFGDTAVAVNPSDKRYKEFIGKKYRINLDGVIREIEIISDRAVDSTYGTGAVGVTPSHSAIDWRMAEEHNLPKIKVIDECGRMTAEAGEKYAGLRTLEAREKLVEYLKNEKLLEKKQEFDNNLSVCYRCNTAIEPIPSLQWFVKIKPLAEKAKKAVESGEIEIIPKRFEKVYFHWMDNIRDWCISRQLWWGHRIPVYYRKPESNSKIQDTITKQIPNSKSQIPNNGCHSERSDNGVEESHHRVSGSKNNFEDSSVPQNDNYLNSNKNSDINHSLKIENCPKGFEPVEEKIENCIDIYVGTTPPEGEGWVQDEDVLDTWFSSALWPFSTLGWPDEKSKIKDQNSKISDYEYFYPTTVMETGYDILFFWVARMIMMGLELTDKVPFKTVYLHGLVRDEKNRKMSKSLGNGIDPLEVIEKYGADALRMALVVGATPGQDIPVGENKIRGYRNFSNKIWNASRFVTLRVSEGNLREGTVGEFRIQDTEYNEKLLTDADKEILKVHKKTKEKVKKYLDEFKFSLAGETLYDYFWHTFCDVYIEEAKEQLENPKSEIRNPKQSQNSNVINSKNSNLNTVSNFDIGASNLSISDNTKKVLINVLSESLVMLHPFVPYVTEAVWQELRQIYPALKESIIIAPWPE